MIYQHDVFISYKRQELWTPWTRDHFKKLLTAYLQQDLGVEPDIFVDERVQVGEDWVESIADHLAKSKVLIAIFSADYFGSEWCLHELDMMLARSAEESINLIVPVVVHDGDHIPKEAKRIQPVDMRKYRIAYINDTTPDYQEFSRQMGELAPQVAALIQTAPTFDVNWVTESRARFNNVYEASTRGETVDTTQFKANRPTPPTSAPKLKI